MGITASNWLFRLTTDYLPCYYEVGFQLMRGVKAVQLVCLLLARVELEYQAIWLTPDTLLFNFIET